MSGILQNRDINWKEKHSRAEELWLEDISLLWGQVPVISKRNEHKSAGLFRARSVLLLITNNIFSFLFLMPTGTASVRTQHIAALPCPPVNLLGYKSLAASIYVTLRETRGRSSTVGWGEKQKKDYPGDSLTILTCNLSINVYLGEKIASLFALSIKKSVSIPYYYINLINYLIVLILCLSLYIWNKASSRMKDKKTEEVSFDWWCVIPS